jgi:ParB family transcriptional regulator, chromosome partitioning protein
VRSMSERALVLTQGQENSTQADLSFIEHYRFTRPLGDFHYGREAIMSMLVTSVSVANTAVTRATISALALRS